MDYAKIMEKLVDYRDDKDWEQFHTTKNLTISICTRAANLLEAFQWKDDEEIMQIIKSDKTEIEEKLADIVLFIFYLSHNLGITSDNFEAAIYYRIIKEYTNMHLTDQQENSQNIHKSKTTEFKHLEKILIISFMSSTVFNNLYPALFYIAELA